MNNSPLNYPHYGTAIALTDLATGLITAILISLCVAMLYRYTHRGLHYERSFLVSLVLISPIVTLVMMLIGSNLALSLGMVGALSIIRFRTVIKDSRDMVFLFWTIAIGLGCGTYNWVPVFLASIIIATTFSILHFARYGAAQHNDYVLVVTGENANQLERVKEIVNSSSNANEIRSYDISDKHWEAVFEFRSLSLESGKEHEIVQKVKELESVTKASLLTPKLSLPM